MPDGVSPDGLGRDAATSETTIDSSDGAAIDESLPDGSAFEEDSSAAFDAADAAVVPDGDDVATPVDGPAPDSPAEATAGDATTTTDAPAGDDGECRAGLTLCGASCVDTREDRANCGACGTACGDGLTCVSGACACPSGSTRCGSECVDTQSSGAHCGGCGNTCGTGQSCAAGACACTTGRTLCGGVCVDAQTSAAHCGMCGNACPAGQSCSMGRCACATGQTLCGGACVDTDSSTGNCGACGTACPAGQFCNGGACSLTCTDGRARCGSGAAMTCVDTRSDSANCGACGTTCPAGSVCRGGACGCDAAGAGRRELCGTGAGAACVDVTSDANNCGACGNACGAGRECRAGVCGCTGGQLLCGAGASAACVDGSSDENNCGGCGTRCTVAANAQLATCLSGSCRQICRPGFGNCDNNATNGCEINLNTDDLNCGACGTRCTIPGQACRGAGVCACAAGQTVCGSGAAAACTDRQTDRNNCGACGTVCPNAQTCQNGTCACPIAGQILCNGACVDPQTDNANCNGCNVACTGGTAPNNRTCRGGSCLCPAGQSFCAASNSCVNTQSDALNCNGCGAICPGQPGGTAAPGGAQACVAGSCTLVCAANRMRCGTGAAQYCADTQGDVNNCGACGSVCTGGKVCSAGGCVCPGAQVDCGGTCRDLTTDPLRCGSCTNICPGQPGGPSTTGGAQLCSMGTCGLTCAAPLSTCGTGAGMYCANRQTDANNCGTCGNVCTGGKVCSSGSCVCPGSQVDCGGTCRDTTSDDLHCNGCNMACPGRGTNPTPPGGAQTCVGSACTLLCSGGMTRCGTGTGQVCADLATSTTHCMSCGNACTGGKICSPTGCVCPSGQVDCGGTCRTLSSDSSNCGVCNNACPSGTTCSSSQCVCSSASTPTLCPPCPAMTSCTLPAACVNTAGSDNANCGGCGVSCTGTGRACAGGNCRCTNATLSFCPAANACVDLQTNEAYCGSCGNACAGGQTCVNGACIAPYPVRISVATDGTQGDRHSPAASYDTPELGVSADGRYVAFSSYASNLSAGDTNGRSDIFVRDTVNNTTALVSRADGASGSVGNNESSYGLAISADGRFVAFSSYASNLVAGDTNSAFDVFVRDTVDNTTTLVSRADGAAGAIANSHSYYYGLAISADGRYVAFSSAASNLVVGDTNTTWDAFVRDTVNNTTTLVSRADGAGGAIGNVDSIYGLAISADGRYVAFSSYASNLIAGDSNGTVDVFVRDTLNNSTTLVSRADGSTGAIGNDQSRYGLAISADGRYVAFGSAAGNLVAGDSNGRVDVFVRDTVNNTTTLVSRGDGVAGALGNDGSLRAVTLSADGRYVTFSSAASNLVVGDTNTTWDAFVRDTANNTTRRISVDSMGVQGNYGSFGSVAISADGRYVAFGSEASNLVAGDTNNAFDVFLTRAHP